MAAATGVTSPRGSSAQRDTVAIRHVRLRAFALVGVSGWMLAGIATLRFVADQSFVAVLVVVMMLTISHAVCVIRIPALSTPTPDRSRELAAAVAGTAELLDGTVPVRAVVPARVVFLARIPAAASGLLGGLRGTAVLQVIMEVQPPDAPARRISVLAPTDESTMTPGSVHAVALHPGREGVGVLDGRVSPDQRAAWAADPRWATAVVPTDRSLMGGRRGQLLLVVFGVLGIVATFSAGLLVVAVVNAVAARLVG